MLLIFFPGVDMRMRLILVVLFFLSLSSAVQVRNLLLVDVLVGRPDAHFIGMKCGSDLDTGEYERDPHLNLPIIASGKSTDMRRSRGEVSIVLRIRVYSYSSSVPCGGLQGR
jgi:hypothetical protein